MPPVKKATTKAPVKKAASTAGKTSPAKKATPKAASAKSTTTKAAVKKTTTTKAATSKATVKNVAAPKAVELSVSGNKKIDTLRKEFNKVFPYLRLGLYYSYMRNEKSKTPLDGNKTLASVRRADSGGDISISGNKKIKTLEKEFDTVFGLYAQVCYTEADGHRYYTSGSEDEKTLAAFNAECEKNGCKKGEYK